MSPDSEEARKKGVGVGEAADLYGSIEQAQEFGYVERGLKSRHIQFIALGGTIGTGLFLGIGGAFAKAGPLAVLLGYTFTGCAVYAMMQCLGEMATWMPLPGAIPQYCSRYVDPALGFAVGWNYWYSCAITLCAEISAASVVIGYWKEDQKALVAAWITIIILLIIALNIFAVRIYGEAEFIFASIKIITIVGLLLMAFILDLGGGPNHQRLGFHYWKDPGPIKQYPKDVAGPTGRFLAVFSTLVQAAFSYGGVEMVAIAAGEAENPLKNIPKAVRRVFWRILFFYVLGSLAVGVLVSSNDPDLLSDRPGAYASPWVIAIKRAGIRGLDHVINAVILTSATSSANAFLYTGSRYLFGVAQNGHAPKVFLTCTKAGIPIWCVAITAIVSLLSYLSVSSGANSVFLWFQNLVTITQLFTWVSICIAYLRFRAALVAQNVDRNRLVFKSKWQPYTAWFALVYFTIIIIFNGFVVFINGHWTVQDFLIAYINIPIFVILYLFWKVLKRTRFVRAEESDIWSGKHAVDNEVWPDIQPRNVWERIWFWIA
ncbi:AAT family amino acid transporter [Microthyrium microscopicum]|uniref:AAT family amino acid transporter n=1 Tax=Microthyrium microscopicum TaxID=703497 RepID=A0A6A6UFZ3_9PEZI|nr:AAT family amino acid transporter [Microthyrium microscopicum]